MKNQTSPFVEIKQVTWAKDSHGLFDYESRNINFNKSKIDSAAKVYKDGTGVAIRERTKIQSLNENELAQSGNYLFSIESNERKDKFHIHCEKPISTDDSDKPFLIVRSLKNEDGSQRGYNLALGDIIRLGRIEYRVIEFRDHLQNTTSLFNETTPTPCPFTITVKDCNSSSDAKKTCRICLMDEQDTPEVLVNPCNCKGTSEYVHVQCLQDWISSKLKKKVNPDAACFYWKKLICEVCKVSLPDLVEVNGEKQELIPISRPDGAYILLERVFYDKSKSDAENAKTLILLNISNENQQIKFGRGHECDLRENDISVSRLHAFIKYHNGQFTIFDNNSKFGTLVLLRNSVPIERKKKVALQFGRTVITFSLKFATVNNIPVFRDPIFMEKLTSWQSARGNTGMQVKTDNMNFSKPKTMVPSPKDETEVAQQVNAGQNGSFLD